MFTTEKKTMKDYWTEEEKARAGKANAITAEVLRLLKNENLTIVDARRILHNAIQTLDTAAFSIPTPVPETVEWTCRYKLPDFTPLGESPRQ